jgi:hypothetical protein
VGDARLLARYERCRRSEAGPVSAVVHAIASRARWPNWLERVTMKGLQIQNDWPILGVPMRRSLVNVATRSGVKTRQDKVKQGK